MDILGEEVTGAQLVKLSVDTLATHQLLQYAKHNNKEERIRLVSGLTLLGIGYLYGPRIQERIAAMKSPTLDEATRERVLYTAGGAILGGIAGRYVDRKDGNRNASPYPLRAASPEDAMPSELERRLQEAAAQQADAGFRRPNGIVLLGSIGWLGYSFLLNGKNAEERTRHIWGIGAGAVGYAFGPDIIHRFDRVTLSPGDADRAGAIYRNGSMLLGATIGGALGWHKSAEIKRLVGDRPAEG